METFSALLAICAGNSPVTGEFPAQRPVTRSFRVFFDLRLNIRLTKQSWGWWFETPSLPLWRHCNVSVHQRPADGGSYRQGRQCPCRCPRGPYRLFLPHWYTSRYRNGDSSLCKIQVLTDIAFISSNFTTTLHSHTAFINTLWPTFYL